ncbi:MAG: ComF family protein [Eubacteriaceae bacterium]|nr:ComF family protein [Eubacteriaceae bacterium]MDD4508109.1 ComF family protein [Eubacteriaceae bacterium]
MAIFSFLESMLFIDNGTCPVCGRVLFEKKSYVCSRCYEALPVNRLRTCKVCGRQMETSEGDICSECLKEKDPVFDGGFSWLVYTGGAKKVIQGFKFESRKALAGWAGKQMADAAAGISWMAVCDGIIPVPLHPNRLKERGYNQSAWIAEGFSRRMAEKGIGLPVENKLLNRMVDTPHQVGTNRDFRLQNMREAFQVMQPERVKGKSWILLDDVMTTGATLRECGRMLQLAGARAVYAVTCAGRS